MTATEASKEALWLSGLVDTFGIVYNSVQIYNDSQSVIHLAKNHLYHKETKHIDVRYHKKRQWVAVKNVIALIKISAKKNSADMMTKTILVEKLEHL